MVSEFCPYCWKNDKGIIQVLVSPRAIPSAVGDANFLTARNLSRLDLNAMIMFLSRMDESLKFMSPENLSPIRLARAGSGDALLRARSPRRALGTPAG